MKILVLTHVYSGNGAAHCLLDVMHRWVHEQGHEVHALCTDDPVQRSAAESTGAKALVEVSSTAYDIAFVNSIVALEGFAAVLDRIPTAIWVHEGFVPLLNTQQTLGRFGQLFSKACALLFQTPWQRDVVFAGPMTWVDPSRAHVLRNCLSPSTHARIKKLLNANQGRSSRAPTWVSCGAVYERKRPQDFAEAVQLLRTIPELSERTGAVIGSLKHMQTVNHSGFAKGPEHLRQVFPGVEFTDELPRDQTLGRVLEGEVFVACSTEETQPLASLEAATMGMPLVLSDLPSYQGIWKHGRDCLMYPIGDVPQLRWQMQALGQDVRLRSRMAQAAQHTAAQYRWDRFTQEFDAVIAQVAAMRRVSHTTS
jgi:glycosyltransferase involved in cell wall biosynthesis